VDEVMGPLMYRLGLPQGWRVNNVFHRSKLHPVTPDQVVEQVNAPQPAITVTEEEQHVVDEVLDTRWTQGHFQCKVRYFRHRPEYDRWVNYNKQSHGDIREEGDSDTPLRLYLSQHPDAPHPDQPNHDPLPCCHQRL
jgi:hypothetical protein